jgi:AraC-like DNA-binding protein/ligand-binding sensor protein
MNANGQIIEALTRSEMFQNYEHAYTEATGMPMTLRSVEAWRLPFHGKRKENDFCAMMVGKSRTCAACLQLQETLTHDAMNKPATRTCAYGLCETAVPVKLGSQTIGFLQTGQVLRQNPTEASFQRAVDQARKLGVDIGDGPVRRAFFKTPVASPKKLEAASNLLAIFADHLAMKSNQLVVQKMNAESPIIVRARQFIGEHYTEDVSLGRISSAVNTSSFYFCKLFRKATSLSFIEFLSRTRLEKAKNLLLNPNLRVTEIAFAVGFQSLTHFNRVFKRIAGQSPTEYRGKLPAAGCQLAGIPSIYPRSRAGPKGIQKLFRLEQPLRKEPAGTARARGPHPPRSLRQTKAIPLKDAVLTLNPVRIGGVMPGDISRASAGALATAML